MDIHVLEFEKQERTIRCIFHIPVPAAGTNIANIQWRNAVAASQNTVSQLSTITAAEQSNLTAGALVEVIETVRFSKLGMSTTERVAEVKAAYQSAKSRVLAELQITLSFYGHSMAGV
jgi:hypothetical protein